MKEKKWYKKWWAILLFIIVGITIISSLGGDNTKVKELEEENAKIKLELNTLKEKISKYSDIIALEDAKSEEQKLLAEQQRKEELEEIEVETKQLQEQKKIEDERNKWEEVFTFSGSTSKKSSIFNVIKGEAKVVWKHLGSGHFSINLIPKGSEYGELLVNHIGATSDESFFYQAGDYFLDINGDTPWEVTVFQNKNE